MPNGVTRSYHFEQIHFKFKGCWEVNVDLIQFL